MSGLTKSIKIYRWLFSLVITGTLLALATLPPFVTQGFRSGLMYAFSFTCHQMPERSPWVHDVQLAVCFRCYGIYWGLVAGALSFVVGIRWDYWIDRWAPWMILGSLLPAGIDWLGGVVGFWDSGSWIRWITGLIFGVTAGYFVARALALQSHIIPADPISRNHPEITS